ncbi:sensor histidine kinase [Sphingomonas xinjiangensis]|uniref:histidine kinase n=1 Tax=Sphingomonas xinjiangensis TaxID=643568 RepID=A0A840YKT0_9SPHN|nr:ATP-binding protein [Sphingomonas xinjiangensis]MBB5711818.1 PAS domain S-box-containing protein [Sphingomonas xinjiangensis]
MDDVTSHSTVAEYQRSTTDAVPALISFFDADHICRYANEHHLLWYGRSPEELVGVHMREFLGNEAYLERLPHLKRVAEGEQVSFEAAVPHRQGGWRHGAIRYVARFGPEGFEGFHTLVFDRTHDQHRFRSVFDGTAMGFLEIDLSNMRAMLAELSDEVEELIAQVEEDTSIVRRALEVTPTLDLNEKACRMLGIDRGSAVGSPLGRWCSDESLEAWNRNLLAYLRGDESYETETVIRREDGSDLDVLLSCAFPKAPDEEVIVVVGLVDISQRIAKERELAKAQADLAHAARVATLGELMASIAHEVNQPLAAVVANGNAALRWLSRAEPNVEETRLAISRIMGEATRASEIIARTRRMAVKDNSSRTRFCVNHMIEEAVEITSRQTSALGASLSLSLAPVMPPLLADRIQLQQVMINLIVNAAQAMEGQPDGSRRITVRSYSCDAGQMLEVADTGPGFADKGDRIFEAFFTTKRDGMGMGLSVAKSIVEAHGGRIMALPHIGGGTVFRVKLPYAGCGGKSR